MKRPVLFLLTFLMGSCLFAGSDFYAYHTKVQHSATDYFGKYADIIVVLGPDRQLEFTRRTGYQPLWKTEQGSWLIDDLYPGRDRDFEFFYNYVRLIEDSPEKKVVHWRYMPDLQAIKQANAEKNPLVRAGFLGVVHEFFTIYPDGRVERLVKDARNTSARDWKNPHLRIRQEIKLTENGVEHGHVDWGGRGAETDEENEAPMNRGRPVINAQALPVPVQYWSFDDGIEADAGYALEQISDEDAEIEGLYVLYKKGVSGTGLAFDGYYTGLSFPDRAKLIKDELTIEAWLALDVYPYNDAPIVHRSRQFGAQGYYFGLDAYGHLLFRINGQELKSSQKLPLYRWQHVAVTAGRGKAALYLNGKQIARKKITAIKQLPQTNTQIGLNTEKLRPTDYVRDFPQNLPFIMGIQGVMDELKVYDQLLSDNVIKEAFETYRPEDLTSPIKKGVLPGEMGVAEKFGAYYKTLPFNELWDNMWRLDDFADVVVKFDHLPTSVIYWHGSNYAANWITDNNHWMSDQSSEIWGPHGCSEHMADKQDRHSFARIIENSPARVVVHWRYPCVDVGYVCTNRLNWSDEYHTIYPDGTGIRQVVWNKGYDVPGFQDIQFFTNPGETALQVVDLQAMDVANIRGDVEKLQWAKPNKIPKITIKDATIELLKSKSKYKIFVIFQGGKITPWGKLEQSKYTDDPFAGPWNHWPMHFVPSDGRFAVDHDRVTHFALGANDYAPQFGSLVHYGFTDQAIESVIPRARFWQNPPQLDQVSGGKSFGFNKAEKAYAFKLEGKKLSFTVNASEQSPLINPAFVIRHWPAQTDAIVWINDKEIKQGSNHRQGFNRCPEGYLGKVIWLEMTAIEPAKIEIVVNQ